MAREGLFSFSLAREKLFSVNLEKLRTPGLVDTKSNKPLAV